MNAAFKHPHNFMDVLVFDISVILTSIFLYPSQGRDIINKGHLAVKDRNQSCMFPSPLFLHITCPINSVRSFENLKFSILKTREEA